MSLVEFLEMVDAHQHHQTQELRMRAAQACWIINAIPHFGKGRKKPVRVEDLVDLPEDEGARKHLTRDHMRREKEDLYELFSRIKDGPYGPVKRLRENDRTGRNRIASAFRELDARDLLDD